MALPHTIHEGTYHDSTFRSWVSHFSRKIQRFITWILIVALVCCVGYIFILRLRYISVDELTSARDALARSQLDMQTVVDSYQEKIALLMDDVHDFMGAKENMQVPTHEQEAQRHDQHKSKHLFELQRTVSLDSAVLDPAAVADCGSRCRAVRELQRLQWFWESSSDGGNHQPQQFELVNSLPTHDHALPSTNHQQERNDEVLLPGLGLSSSCAAFLWNFTQHMQKSQAATDHQIWLVGPSLELFLQMKMDLESTTSFDKSTKDDDNTTTTTTRRSSFCDLYFGVWEDRGRGGNNDLRHMASTFAGELLADMSESITHNWAGLGAWNTFNSAGEKAVLP